MKKNSTTKQPLEDKNIATCKGCGIKYNRDNVARVYGNESSVLLGGYHSAECYTKSVTKDSDQLDKSALIEICGSVVPISEVEKVWREHCKIPTPDSKEGLHTQDCLFMGTTTKLSDGGYEAIIQVKRGDGLQDDLNIHVWHPTKGEAEANAELIVEAVNERKALLDSHRELLDALIHAQNVIDRLDDEYRDLAERHSSYTRGDFKKIETAINNAKNIK